MITNYKEFALRRLKNAVQNIMLRDVIVNGGNKMERNMPPPSSVVSDQRFAVIVFYPIMRQPCICDSEYFSHGYYINEGSPVLL